MDLSLGSSPQQQPHPLAPRMRQRSVVLFSIVFSVVFVLEAGRLCVALLFVLYFRIDFHEFSFHSFFVIDFHIVVFIKS